MNKLLIVLLAICLFSVHMPVQAFVKRDAETPQPDPMKTIQKGFEDFSKSVSEFFDADNIKKGFNDVVDNVNAAVNKLSSQKTEGGKQ